MRPMKLTSPSPKPEESETPPRKSFFERLKAKLYGVVGRLNELGPVALVVADRIAHVFGIELGMH